MNRIMHLSITVAVCAAMAVVTGSCGKKGGGRTMPPAAVKVAIAVRTDTPVIISAFGNTEERMSVDIVPQVSGVLMKSLIKDGEIVKEGQPLFEIDPRDYDARVKQAEGMVKADRANLELAMVTLKRNEPLFEKGQISKENCDMMKTKVQSVEAQLQIDEASLDLAKLNLARCTIKSPMDGACSKRYFDAGNLVAAGITRLTNIRSYDPIRVAFTVSDQYLPAIRKAVDGGKVKIEITPRGDTNSYAGTLEFIDNAVSMATGTILLRGEVPNKDMLLWANQFVDVRIYAGVVPGAVMVPEGAVQYGKQGPYLYVASVDSKAEMRSVKIGVRYNDLIQVIEGVAADESVVILGQFMLYPGAQVMDVSKIPSTAGKPPVEAAKEQKDVVKQTKDAPETPKSNQ